MSFRYRLLTGAPLRAITLTQPWATLVADHHKRIETRSWKTYYRGLIGIHSAKSLWPVDGIKGLRVLCQKEPFHSSLQKYDDVGQLPRGHIVALAELVSVVPLEEILGKERFEVTGAEGETYQYLLDEKELALGNYEPTRFAWLLDAVTPLSQSVPAIGQQALWDVPRPVRSQIIDALP